MEHESRNDLHDFFFALESLGVWSCKKVTLPGLRVISKAQLGIPKTDKMLNDISSIKIAIVVI